MKQIKQSDENKVPLQAIALAYKEPGRLPTVLASGRDELARLIIEIARNAEIPIHENKELVSLLDKQRPGTPISSRALKVLSEVIAFLYHADTQVASLPLASKS